MSERGKIRKYKISPQPSQSIYDIEIGVDNKSLIITYREKERFFIKTFTIGNDELFFKGWTYKKNVHLIITRVVLMEKQFSIIEIGMDELPGGLSIIPMDTERLFPSFSSSSYPKEDICSLNLVQNENKSF